MSWRKEATKLTAKIKEFMLQGKFLSAGKTVAEIQDELIRLKQISADKVSSSDIAGVMRNLLSDNTVKVGGKDGRKNVDVKVQQTE